MSSSNINWYPGHMFKTKRELKEAVNMVDVAVEVLDARIPLSSRNYDLVEIIDRKSRINRIIVLNKVDLADPDETDRWINKLTDEKTKVIKMDSSRGKGIKELKEAIKSFKGNKISTVRTLIMGIPNVGKSTLINSLNGKKSLEAKNKPGVTKALRWLRVDNDISVLDTPGMLWPKFKDENIGYMLATTGAIKDEIFDSLEVAYQYIKKLDSYENKKDINKLLEKYGVTQEEFESLKDDFNPYYSLILLIAEKKKMLIRGGEPDEYRCSKALLTDYRAGRTGRITLEKANDR